MTSGAPFPRFSAHNFFGMDLREMLAGIPSQMMDTCYGENHMKISRPNPNKKCRITMYESILNNIKKIRVYITVLHEVACQIHIVQSETLVTHKTVNT